MKASTVAQYIEEVVEEWEPLGLALQLPNHTIKEINMDGPNMESKRKELIRRWMNTPELCGPACWWLLVKALEDNTVKMNSLAARIRKELGMIIPSWCMYVWANQYSLNQEMNMAKMHVQTNIL